MKFNLVRKRFVKSEEGAAALEFAIVATPFFALLFAILEVSLIYFGSVALENGMQEAARMVRTGQLQVSGGSVDDFKTKICESAGALLDCTGELYIDVRTFAEFDDADFPDPITGGEISGGFLFNPGVAGDVVLVRAFYIWNVTTPIIGDIMANMNGGRRLLSTSAAFRNEPFQNIVP